MESLVIQKFPFGRDTRRSVLTSQPGTLVTANNVLVNEGGELEGRKSFVQFANVSILDGNGDAGTFGLEATEVGLVVFGSSLPHGSAKGQSQPKLASDMPTGIKYVWVQHPSLFRLTTVNYSRTLHRMTGVRKSESYKGKPVLIGQFTTTKFSVTTLYYFLYSEWTLISGDGTALPYYQATLVQQSQNGMVFDKEDNSDQWVELAREVALLSDQGFNTAISSTLTRRGELFSPPGVGIGIDVSETSTTGLVGFFNKGLNGPTAQPTAAYTAFQVTALPTSPVLVVVSAPSASDGSGSFTLATLTGASEVGATTVICATNIANEINAFTNVTGYSAYATGSNVVVWAPAIWGSVTFNVTVIGGASFTTAAVVQAGTLTILTDVTSVTGVGDGSTLLVTSDMVNLYALGGTPSYIYAWEAVHNPNQIAIGSASNSATNFSGNLIPVNVFGLSSITGTFRCKVTDGGAVIAYSPIISVTLSNGL